MSIESDNRIRALEEHLALLIVRVEALEHGRTAMPPVYQVRRRGGWPKGRRRRQENGNAVGGDKEILPSGT